MLLSHVTLSLQSCQGCSRSLLTSLYSCDGSARKLITNYWIVLGQQFEGNWGRSFILHRCCAIAAQPDGTCLRQQSCGLSDCHWLLAFPAWVTKLWKRWRHLWRKEKLSQVIMRKILVTWIAIRSSGVPLMACEISGMNYLKFFLSILTWFAAEVPYSLKWGKDGNDLLHLEGEHLCMRSISPWHHADKYPRQWDSFVTPYTLSLCYGEYFAPHFILSCFKCVYTFTT